MKTFAVVDNNGGIVSNIVVGESIDLVSSIVGSCVEQTEETGNAEIGASWNGSVFTRQPYPSWKVTDTFDWEAPIPMPETDGPWIWNEGLGNWEELS